MRMRAQTGLRVGAVSRGSRLPAPGTPLGSPRAYPAALAAEIWAREIRGGPGSEPPAVSDVRLTSTGVAIIVVAGIDEAAVVVKLPMSANAARRLEREAAILSVIHDEPRLATWRRLVPRPLAAGILRGQPYRVETAFAGDPGLRWITTHERCDAMLVAAAAAINVLHRVTSQSVRVDRELAERWVDVNVRELAGRATRTSCRRRLGDLRGELHRALVGKTLWAARIHGDFWPGNILLEGSDVGLDSVVGIVDWDASGPVDLPLHDLFHLLLSTRCLLTGRELGQVVREHLVGRGWKPPELALLEHYHGWPPAESLSHRHALLLYWLRHAALHAGQQNLRPGWRYRVWEHRNVLPVLSLL